MSSRCPDLRAIVAAALLCAGVQQGHAEEARVLRVCADPDNLPYSSQQGEGFENRIAELLAAELHATLQYDWWPQRRGYVRRTIGANMCDVLIGVPADFERVSTTRPYYRSAYVFVTRQADRPPGFDSAAIRSRRIGVQFGRQQFGDAVFKAFATLIRLGQVVGIGADAQQARFFSVGLLHARAQQSGGDDGAQVR
ncbi:MAG: hypothetical protein ACJ8HI_00450 [Massilia sp.]